MPAGSRVRANNVYGTISDNPLLIGATSYTSLGLSLLPAVASPTQHAVAVFDPKRVFGEPEIVAITLHTALGTTATITRAQYGTVARAHPQGTAWAHVPVGPDDYTAIVTSGTLPGNPYVGQTVFETDLDKFVARNAANSAWVDTIPLSAWVSYVPSNTNITIGNGTQVAMFARVGRIIFIRYSLLWGSTTSYGGTVAIGLPVAAVGVGSKVQQQSLATTLLDDSARYYIGLAVTNETDATHAGIMQTTGSTNATGRVDATSPFTWTISDQLSVTGCYESAT